MNPSHSNITSHALPNSSQAPLATSVSPVTPPSTGSTPFFSMEQTAVNRLVTNQLITSASQERTPFQLTLLQRVATEIISAPRGSCGGHHMELDLLVKDRNGSAKNIKFPVTVWNPPAEPEKIFKNANDCAEIVDKCCKAISDPPCCKEELLSTIKELKKSNNDLEASYRRNVKRKAILAKAASELGVSDTDVRMIIPAIKRLKQDQGEDSLRTPPQ